MSSLCVIFADSIIYFAGYDCYIADIVIWVIVPLIVILFIMEYLMICRLFSCKVLNFTSCDFIYIFCILSLLVELTRITPTMSSFTYYSLDEDHEYHHIDNQTYWKHKLFDSFIDLNVRSCSIIKNDGDYIFKADLSGDIEFYNCNIGL